MKRLLIVSLFFIFASIDIFAQSKPDSNAVFNYYVACATGDVKAAENFLIQYPDCVDIELSFDNFFASILLIFFILCLPTLYLFNLL